MNGNSEPEHRIRRGGSLASSGLLTALILAGVLGALGFVWSAHLKGRLHKLGNVEVPPDTSTVPRPGGQDIVDLHRITPAAGVTPQFTGLTVLPGVGMSVLQLLLDLPGRDMEGILKGTPVDQLSAELVPYTNLPKSGLQTSTFSLKVSPASGAGAAMELLGLRPATSSRTDILPGGTGATATFASSPPPGADGVVAPASGVETSVTTNVSDRGLDVSITAKNVSETPRKMALTWSPRLMLPPGGLEKLRISPPDTASAPVSAGSDIALSGKEFHRTWTGLRHSYLSLGPELQLRNLADGYTLKMTALTPSIHTVTVNADAAAGSIGFDFSTDGGTAGSVGGGTVVGPGETLEWRLRVQVTANQSYVAPVN